MATDSSNTPTHADSNSATAFAAPSRTESLNRSVGEGSATSWLNQPRNTPAVEPRSAAEYSSDQSTGKSLGDHGTMWNQEGAIEFRVRSESHPTRRLRLAGARYTLGNGVGCSIRLDDPTLRPLHAVLIRDAHRILIRAYSIPLLINNVRVTEGTLQQGDVLRLGNYEFELVQAKFEETKQQKPTTHRFAESVPRLASGNSASMFDSNVEFQKEAARWHKLKEEAEKHDHWVRERQEELKKQADQIEAQFKALREREDEIRSQETAAVELHAEFQVRHRDLTERQDQLAAQQNQLEQQREDWKVQQERLQGRDAHYRTQIEELLLEKESLFERERDSERQLNETRQQLKESQSQADAAAEAVTQMRTKFASLNEQLLALGEQQESLQTMGLERVEEHARQCKELSAARDEAIAQRESANKERDDVLDQKASSDAKLYETRERCDDLLKTEESLREEIESLQIEISDARKEAEALRRDCQHARTTIGELEARVRESENRHDTDRTSWSDEMDALRNGVDELTLSLAQAEQQLAQLREDNDKLRETLSLTEEQRNEFKTKYKTSEKQRIRAEREVSETRQLFDRSNRDHDDTLDQIERLEEETRHLISGKNDAESNAPASNVRLGILSASDSLTADEDGTEETIEPLESADASSAEDNTPESITDGLGLHIASEPVQEVTESAATGEHASNDLIDEAMSVVHDSETDRLLEEAEEKAASWSTPIAEETVEETDDEDAWPTYESAVATDLPNLDAHVSNADAVGADEFSNETSKVDANDSPSPAWPDESESLLLPAERLGNDAEPCSDAEQLNVAEPLNDVINNEINESVNLDSGEANAVWASVSETDEDDSAEDVDAQMFAAEFTAAAQEEAEQIREARLSQEWNSEELSPETVSESNVKASDDIPVEASLNDDNPWATADLDQSFPSDEPSAEQQNSFDDADSQSPLSLADQLIRDLSNEKTSDETELSLPNEELSNETGTQMWDGQADYAPEADLDAGLQDTTSEGYDSNELTSTQPHSLDQQDSEEPLDVADEFESSLASIEEESAELELPSTNEVAAETVVAPEAGEPDDDSIEAYMNRLLQRVQKQSGDEAAPAAEKPQKAATEPVEIPVQAETTDHDLEPEVIEPVDPNAPLIPRSQAPERNSNLSAMRELANESARSAVERSAKSQSHSSRVQAMVKFSQAVVAIICGIAAVTFVAQGTLKIVAAVAALLIAVICVKEGLTLLNSTRGRSPKQPAVDPAEEIHVAEVVE
ncbi:MAG: FHA domain-containing protein [Rhodopirellula bahusiensis]